MLNRLFWADFQPCQVEPEAANGFDAFIGRFVSEGEAADTLVKLGFFRIPADQIRHGTLESAQVCQCFSQFAQFFGDFFFVGPEMGAENDATAS